MIEVVDCSGGGKVFVEGVFYIVSVVVVEVFVVFGVVFVVVDCGEVVLYL